MHILILTMSIIGIPMCLMYWIERYRRYKQNQVDIVDEYSYEGYPTCKYCGSPLWPPLEHESTFGSLLTYHDVGKCSHCNATYQYMMKVNDTGTYDPMIIWNFKQTDCNEEESK